AHRPAYLVRLAAKGGPPAQIIPEALLREDPWQKGLDPPLDEMVLNLPDWRCTNRDCVRVHVPCLFALAQGVRRAHCWLRKCRLAAGNPDCRGLLFRRMTTPCHSGPRENEHTPWLHVCWTYKDRAGSGAWHAQRDQVRGPAHLSKLSPRH